jgi:hypothetical protein
LKLAISEIYISKIEINDVDMKKCFASRTPSSGMWRQVGHVKIDVSEEYIASIFRVDKFASEE